MNSIPEGYPVYGRNGVEADPVGETENEMGLIIKAKSKSEEIAKNLLGLWKGLFLHYGYEGRRSTAGNLAFPLSPSQVTYQDKDGTYVSFVVAGTRDPFFQEKFASIREEVGRRVQKDYPKMAGQGTVEISLGDRQAPWLYLETVGESREEASVRHREEYRKALDSGCFVKEEIARLLRVTPDRIMGVFRADSCFAIKITLHREILSGSRGDRDLFGAQQHVRLMNMNIPV